MTINQQYPVIDGIAPSWADIQTVINVAGGQTVTDIDYAAFKFASMLEIGEQRGASGGRVMRRTSGSKSDTASATYYMSGFRKLVAELSTAAQSKGYVRGNQVLVGLVTFDIQVLYTPPGEDDIYEAYIKGARLTKMDLSAAEGSDAQQIEIEFSTAEVAWKVDGREIVLI